MIYLEKDVGRPMYVQEIIKKKGPKLYKTVLIRESYREGKKVRSRTVANISKLPERCIDLIKKFFNNNTVESLENLDQVQVLYSKEYGASFAGMTIARELQLDRMIYSRKVGWREDILAMIVGRILYPGSKLSLTNMFADTALWELCGHGPNMRPDVDKHCYQPLDQLLQRQEAIQKSLSEKYLKDGCIVLYDITSSYFEGEYEESGLVTYGYNRDRKKGHEQVNIGLLTNAEGCPVAIDVFPGNTLDQMTVRGQIKKITEVFQVQEVIFVGDREMLTSKRITEAHAHGFKTVTALTHSQMQKLVDRGIIFSHQFSKDTFSEVTDPEMPGLRYILCFNLERKTQEGLTRIALIEKSKMLLEELSRSKKIRKEKDLGAAVGKIWAKYKTEKYFLWTIEDNKLNYFLKQSVIDKEMLLDGCYIICTNVGADVMSATDVVKAYKKLSQVEQAFRIIKTTTLEIRPVFHQLDDRICAHVFLCMLAYYLQWHMQQRLESIFEKDGQGKNKRWTFLQVIESLKSIRSQSLKIADTIIDAVKTSPNQEQKEILNALHVNM